MEAEITYNPENYPSKINNFIMLKAEQWKCSPGEALARLLDQLAEEGSEKSAA